MAKWKVKAISIIILHSYQIINYHFQLNNLLNLNSDGKYKDLYNFLA